MADFKRLTINLSLFTTDQGSKSPNWTLKSPRNFENGIVGLGIVAAMNDLSHTHHHYHQRHVSPKSTRASAILAATSPRSNSNSNPIPIESKSLVNPKPTLKNDPVEASHKNNCVSSKFGGKPNSSFLKKDLMEMSESYTCVISHIGNDLVKKREYFDDDDVVDDACNLELSNCFTATTSTYMVNEGVFSASPSSYGEAAGMMMMMMKQHRTGDFLSSCFLCNKKLHGLDIFMYRGEKAFCSAECRAKQMANDDHKEKCGSGAMKPLDYSVPPCSGPMLFYAGVAAA